MNTERFSLTMAPGGENHRGNQLIGRMPVKGEGFTHNDISFMEEYFNIKNHDGVEVLDLNLLSGIETEEFKNIDEDNYAKVLILRNYSNKTREIYKELVKDEWDSRYLDPNKYRVEIIDGKEIRKRGRVLNKHARRNLCYVAGMQQTPNYIEGKGTIVDLNTKEDLKCVVMKLEKELKNALSIGGSESKVEINVVEGNRYYDLKKTGIGFHGDTERVVVICLTIGGGGGYPMRWQWFKDGKPIGNSINMKLNDGDVYIMSEKAVGTDWKMRSKYTLRHAAGAEKYRSLKKWQKRAEKKSEEQIKNNQTKINFKKKKMVVKRPKIKILLK